MTRKRRLSRKLCACSADNNNAWLSSMRRTLTSLSHSLRTVSHAWPDHDETSFQLSSHQEPLLADSVRTGELLEMRYGLDWLAMLCGGASTVMRRGALA